ncbi:MAG: HAD family acid phosphatase [Ignavibacteriaceae bacterium]
MNIIQKITTAIIILTGMALVSCSSTLPNLSVVKEEVINYYHSGKYEAELNNVIDNAIPEFDKVEVSGSSLVVFDIDETALFNYSFDESIDFGFVPALWEKWVDSAKAPAVDGVKRLYDFLIKKGFKVAFITGRSEHNYIPTYKNLLFAGYTKFDTLIVRNASEKNLSALDYKSKKRVELTKKGYNIVGDIGDQYSDLEGPEHGIQVKIPNYTYIVR